MVRFSSCHYFAVFCEQKLLSISQLNALFKRRLRDINGESPGAFNGWWFFSLYCTSHSTVVSPQRWNKSGSKISLVDLFANEEPLKCLCISLAKLMIKAELPVYLSSMLRECLFKNIQIKPTASKKKLWDNRSFLRCSSHQVTKGRGKWRDGIILVDLCCIQPNTLSSLM